MKISLNASVVLSLLLTALVTAAPQSVAALTLDTLEGDGVVSSTNVVGSTKSLYIPSSGAVGGGRSLSVTKGGAGSGFTQIEVADKALGYTQGAHLGLGRVIWDGDTDPTTVNPVGLGGVNLLQDTSSSFVLGINFFDYPFNQPLQVILKVYDSSTSDGSKSSEVAISVNQAWGGPDTFQLLVPFSLFATAGAGSVPAPQGLTFPTTTVLGTGGAADLRQVGAITLTFNGMINSKAPDMMISIIATDGRCTSVPNAQGRVVDECSVCLESSDANKGKDLCGTCLAGPKGYSYSANSVVDGCNLCPGQTNYKYPGGTTDSCGICLSGPPPYDYESKRGNCPVTGESCKRVAPTKQIKGFETSLLKKAEKLTQRFIDDSKRFASRGCEGSFVAEDEIVGTAYQTIVAVGKEIFSKGVLVCGNSCVTLSYADQVNELKPQFAILERQTVKMAKKVQQCYKKLGVGPKPVAGGAGAAGLISDVRTGLAGLIAECRRTRVCPK